MRIAKILTVHPVHRPSDVKYIFIGEDDSRLGEAGRTLEKGTYYEGPGGAVLRQFLENLRPPVD
ncbi:hypothetical protein LCGC14_2680690 [marine sediment metagenome]|uniref:Uncharacterized protein n=1 Tax=marine sediment metagenome TaxID=412755 RepID=A0A0F8ZLE6_9ZZZZ